MNHPPSRLFVLFGEACALSPEARARFVDEVACSEPDLGRELRALLAADANASTDLESGLPTALVADALTGSYTDQDDLRQDLNELTGWAPPVGRFEEREEIGHGAMGQVHRVWDAALRRTVARKTMQSASNESSNRMRATRFLAEARVTGGLEHPGIVPVHDLGVDAHGEPFFTMQQVRGRTLQQVYEILRLGTEEWPRPRVLAVLQRVCEAMAYAHSQGVVHRDLKPDNVMVGAFGEVYVMDWGVARVGQALDGQLRHDGTPAREDVSAARMTLAGAVVGTPPFMAPEQAAGRSEDVDERSDVYAVGAMLYELLAGERPYSDGDSSSGALLHRIVHEPPKPLTANRGVPPELAAICAKAMARERDDRYQDMLALRDDLRAFVEQRVVAAHRTGALVELRMWVRRNTLAAAAFLLVGVALAGGAAGTMIGMVRAQRRADELELVSQFQESQLQGIDPAAFGADLRRGVIEQSTAAMQRAGLEQGDIEQRSKQLEDLLAGANFTNLGLGVLEKNVFERALAAIDGQFPNQPLVRARPLQAVAHTMHQLGLLAAASQAYQRVTAIYREVLGSNDARTLTAINDLGVVLLDRSEHLDAETYIREALAGRRSLHGADHTDTLASLHNLALVLDSRGNRQSARDHYVAVLAGFRRVHGQHHRVYLTTLMNLGLLQRDLGDSEAAAASLREALAGRERAFGAEHVETLIALGNLGLILTDIGRHEEAERCHRRAVAGLRRQRGDSHPRTLKALELLGTTLLMQQRLDEAEPLLRESVDIQRRTLGPTHEHTLATVANLGLLHNQRGERDAAEACYAEAYEGFRRTRGPEDPRTLRARAMLVNFQFKVGKTDEALAAMREIATLRAKVLGPDDPEALESTVDLATSLMARGSEAQQQEAETLCREVLPRMRRVIGEDDPNTLLLVNNLGFLLMEQGRLDEAEPLLQEALARSRAARGNDESRAIPSIYYNLGRLLRQKGDLVQAEPLLREALERSVRRDGKEAPVVRQFVDELGALLIELCKADLAAERYAQCERRLLETYERFSTTFGESSGQAIGSARKLVALYAKWHAAEPGAGHDAKADPWHKKLNLR